MFDLLTSEPSRPQQDSATVLAPPAIQAALPTVTVTAGEAAVNNLTWQDVDATAGNPVQLIGMVLGAGSITNVSDLTQTSGTAQWVLNGASTAHAGVIVVRILDGDNLVGTAQFNLVVNDPPENILPTITARQQNVPVNVGDTVANIFDWTDGDATILKPVSFTILQGPAGGTIGSTDNTQPSGFFTYTYANAQLADDGDTVEVQITDADGATASATFTIGVTAAGTPPVPSFDNNIENLNRPIGAEQFITGTFASDSPVTASAVTINGRTLGGSTNVNIDNTNKTFSISTDDIRLNESHQDLQIVLTNGSGAGPADTVEVRWSINDILRSTDGHPLTTFETTDLLVQQPPIATAWESSPTWLNHANIDHDGGITIPEGATGVLIGYGSPRSSQVANVKAKIYIPDAFTEVDIVITNDGVDQAVETITGPVLPTDPVFTSPDSFNWEGDIVATDAVNNDTLRFVARKLGGAPNGDLPFLVLTEEDLGSVQAGAVINVPAGTTTINDPVTTYTETLGKGIQNHKNIELRDLVTVTGGDVNSVTFSIVSSVGNASGGGTTEIVDNHTLAYQVTDSGVTAGIQTVVVRASLAGADDKTFTLDLVNVAGVFCRPNASDANPGTWASPKRTIEEAVNTAADGQDVWAHAGVYNEDPANDLRFMPLFINGRNDMEIRPLEDQGTAVISGNEPGGNEFGITANYFDGAGGQNQGWSVTAHGLVFITNSKRITLDGFEIRNSNMAGVSVHNETVRPSAGNWCEDIIIRRNYIHDTRTQGIAVRGQDILANGTVPKLQNISVIDNILDMVNTSALEGPSDWRAPANAAEQNQINAFSGGGEGLTVSKISGFEIIGNIITNYHREGSSFNSVDNGEIAYNLWHTHVWNQHYPKSGRGTGLYLDSNELGMQDVDVHHNASIRNTNTAMAMNTEAQEGVNEGFDRVRVWNNLFLDSYNHGGGGFGDTTRRRRSIEFAGSAGASAGPEPLRDVEIFHNILEGDIVMAGYSQAQFNLWTNFRLVNNIFYRNVFSTVRLINLSSISFSGTHTVDNNSFYNGGGSLISIGTNHGTNRITTNPNMTSVTRAMARDRQLPAFGWPEQQVDYDRPQQHFDASGLIAIPNNIDFFDNTRQAPNPSVGAINVAAGNAGNLVGPIFVNGTSSIVVGTYTATSTSTPSGGALITDLQYTITFTDPGNPNDGRVIVVAGAPGVAPTVQSDTGGTPAARLTDAMINGVSENWNFSTAAASADTVDANATVITSLQVTDSAPNVATQPII